MENKATSTKGANQTENLTFPIYNAKGEVIKYLHPDEVKTLPTLVGKLINDITERCYFFAGWPLHSMKVVIPSNGGGKGEKERAGKALQSIVAAIFEGSERDQIITDAKKVAMLDTFKKKGFAFTTYSLVSVNEAVKARISNQVQRIALQKELTNALPINLALNNQTKLIKGVRTALKTDGIKGAISFVAENKAAKLLPEVCEG